MSRITTATAVFAWLVLGHAGAVLAVTGTGVLATAPEAADLIRVNCYDDGAGSPASLVAEITDVLPVVTPFVSVQIAKGSLASNATDAVDGDGTPGPPISIDGGAGDYDVFVDKSGAGEEHYSLSVQCMTGAGGTGLPTGTFVADWALAVPLAGVIGQAAAIFLLAATAVRRLRGATTGRGR